MTHEAVSVWPGLARPSTARLRAATGAFKSDVDKGAWVYIMTNRPNGTLYVGSTTNLSRRIWEHREGLIEGFTKRYSLKRLVYAEHHHTLPQAVQRERNLKHWPRAWKIRLILKENLGWDDLYDHLV